jgi:RHS repeat-associated protein
MTSDGLNTMIYDGENRIATSTQAGVTTNYSYDGNGLRVKKVSGSTTTAYVFSGVKVIAEYVNGAAPASPAREYLYAGSQMLAKIESGAVRYFLRDHLSSRKVTDSTGAIVESNDPLPFGETTSTGDKWKFTSYERDSESGNDYAMARGYVNRLGRFSSPDPLAGSITDPQSLNRYAYVRNDPVNLVDPLGLGWCFGLWHINIWYEHGTGKIIRRQMYFEVWFCVGDEPSQRSGGEQVSSASNKNKQQDQRDKCGFIQENYNHAMDVSNAKWWVRFWYSAMFGFLAAGPPGAVAAGGTALLYDESKSEKNTITQSYKEQWDAAHCLGSLISRFE